MRATRKEVFAIIVALIAAFATILGAVTAVSASSSPQPSKMCVEIYQQYSAEIAKGPKQREAMLPGVDGRSILTSDPDAKACVITPEYFS